jgi:hypothetical protein
MNNEILFKMPYDVRKVIAVNMQLMINFEDVQIACIKRGNGKDILKKKLQDAVIIGEIITTISDVLE